VTVRISHQMRAWFSGPWRGGSGPGQGLSGLGGGRGELDVEAEGLELADVGADNYKIIAQSRSCFPRLAAHEARPCNPAARASAHRLEIEALSRSSAEPDQAM
jgi:hypothetical protein